MAAAMAGSVRQKSCAVTSTSMCMAPAPRRDGARVLALVGDGGARERRRERQRRRGIEPRHHGQHRSGIDAAGEEHAEGNVGALMCVDRIAPGSLEAGLSCGQIARPLADRHSGKPLAGDDAAFLDHQALTRQHPRDAGERRLRAGRELHRQEIIARGRVKLRRDQAGGDQRLRLGGKSKALRRFGDVERLDAERIARQDQCARPPHRGAPARTCRAGARETRQTLRRRLRRADKDAAAFPSPEPVAKRTCHRSRRSSGSL